jgi:hypothetical protein
MCVCYVNILRPRIPRKGVSRGPTEVGYIVHNRFSIHVPVVKILQTVSSPLPGRVNHHVLSYQLSVYSPLPSCDHYPSLDCPLASHGKACFRLHQLLSMVSRPLSLQPFPRPSRVSVAAIRFLPKGSSYASVTGIRYCSQIKLEPYRPFSPLCG